MSKIRLHYLDVLSRKTIISNTHFFLSFCIVTCEQLTEFKYLLHIFGKMLVMHKMPTVKNPNPNLKKMMFFPLVSCDWFLKITWFFCILIHKRIIRLRTIFEMEGENVGLVSLFFLLTLMFDISTYNGIINQSQKCMHIFEIRQSSMSLCRTIRAHCIHACMSLLMLKIDFFKICFEEHI